MELSAYKAEFESLGFKVAAMTYDSLSITAKFTKKNNINFPILHDIDAQHVKSFGVLNMNYELGHRVYGIPLPGILLLDADGVLLAKFAEEDYKDRPDFTLVIEAARKAVGL